MKRFWCIRCRTNIEVKIRDCPGAFGTDGGSGYGHVWVQLCGSSGGCSLPLKFHPKNAFKRKYGKQGIER